MRLLVGLAVCVAGCDGATEVVVAASADAVIVVQDGDGPWTQVAVSNGEVRFTSTTGLFGVTWMCPDVLVGPTTHSHMPQVMFVTDPELLYPLECFSGFPDREYVTLTGTAPTGTQIFSRFDAWPTEVGESGVFGLSLERGRNDVIAYRPGAPARFLRRSIDLQADTELPFPVDTDGLIMPVQTPTIVGAPDDGLRLYADVNTENGVVYAYFEGTPPTVNVPPFAGLLATDRATIGANSAGCTTQLPLTEADPTLIMPRPMDAGVSRRYAQWNADPEVAWEGVMVHLGFGATMIYASQSYLEAAGNTEALPIVDVVTLPGWHAGLGGLADGDTVDWELGRVRGTYDGELQSCWTSGSFTW